MRTGVFVLQDSVLTRDIALTQDSALTYGLQDMALTQDIALTYGLQGIALTQDGLQDIALTQGQQDGALTHDSSAGRACGCRTSSLWPVPVKFPWTRGRVFRVSPKPPHAMSYPIVDSRYPIVYPNIRIKPPHTMRYPIMHPHTQIKPPHTMS